jgi:hypothetical protein
METLRSYETSENFYQTVQRHNSENFEFLYFVPFTVGSPCDW